MAKTEEPKRPVKKLDEATEGNVPNQSGGGGDGGGEIKRSEGVGGSSGG